MDTNREIAELNNVMLYDGICIFCNTAVDFILTNEKNHELLFVHLQSDLGKEILREYEYPVDYMESILFLTSGKVLAKSTAALEIAKFLVVPFSWMRIFLIMPRFLRDFFYGIVAKNRYKLFGKFDTCMVPSVEEKKRFLE